MPSVGARVDGREEELLPAAAQLRPAAGHHQDPARLASALEHLGDLQRRALEHAEGQALVLHRALGLLAA
eukprot:10202848-Alexandrium_andersonii.AAC.1